MPDDEVEREAPAPPEYLLDSDTFIAAKNGYYGADFVPGYWQALIRHHDAGRVFSVDRVRTELTRPETRDEIMGWIDFDLTPARDGAFFLRTDGEAVVERYGSLADWVVNRVHPDGRPYYRPAAVAKFAGTADGWLAAYAAEHGMTLVTQEAMEDTTRKDVPIPSLCAEAGVRQIDTFAMLRELGVRLVLADDTFVAS